MAVESNIHSFHVAAQPGGKGTAAAVTTPVKHPIVVGGDVTVNRDDGSENYSDLDSFGNQTDFVQQLLGNGNPTIEAQPTTLAYLLWLFFGAEAFTAKVTGTSNNKHVFEPGALTGLFSKWWKRVGLTDVVRQLFADCYIQSVRIEGSSANKIVKITPTFTSLDPGEIFTSDPSVDIDTVPPFLYTEGKGSFTVDGVQLSGHSQFAIVVDFGATPWFGDDVVPYSMIRGNASIALDGITLLLDSASIGRYYQILYGTATPSAGAKPLHSLPALGAYQCELLRGTGDTRQRFKVEVPKVKWSPDLNVPPNPDGGPIEIALAGSMRKQTTAPKSIRLTVENDDLAYAA